MLADPARRGKCWDVSDGASVCFQLDCGKRQRYKCGWCSRICPAFMESNVLAIFLVGPIAVLIGLLIFSRQPLADSHAVLVAFVGAAFALVVVAVGSAVGLSLAKSLTSPAVVGVWAGVLLCVLGWTLHRRTRVVASLRTARVNVRLNGWSRTEQALAALILCVVGIAFFQAALTSPSNWDSHIYHLTRQVFWIDAQSVFLEKAPFTHLLTMPPLGEYIGVNLFLLSGGDALHNLVQWLAGLSCLVLIWLLGGQAGASRLQKLVACFAWLTFPPAFHQFSNTKNDILLSAFLLFVVFGLAVIFSRRVLTFSLAMMVGAGAGLALLTKGTALPYLAAIFLCAAGVQFFRPVRIRLLPILASACVAFLFLSPHYIRQFGYLAASEGPGERRHVNASYLPQDAIAVVARNVGMLLAVPSEPVNDWIFQAVEATHRLLGRSLNDTATGSRSGIFAVAYSTNEDNSSAPAQVLVIAIALGVACWQWRSMNGPHRVWWVVSVLAFILFCWLFRWRPWQARLLVPEMALLALPACMSLVRARFAKPVAWMIVFLCGAALLPHLGAYDRPIYGERAIFAQPKTLRDAMSGPAISQAVLTDVAAPIINAFDIKSLGFDPKDQPTYLFLKSILLNRPRPPRIETIDEARDALWAGRPGPQAILLRETGGASIGGADLVTHGYALVFHSGGWELWLWKDLVESVRASTVSPPFAGIDDLRGFGDPSRFIRSAQPVLLRPVIDGRAEVRIPAHAEPVLLQVGTVRNRNDLDLRILLDGRKMASWSLDKRSPRVGREFVIPPSDSPIVLTLEATPSGVGYFLSRLSIRPVR